MTIRVIGANVLKVSYEIVNKCQVFRDDLLLNKLLQCNKDGASYVIEDKNSTAKDDGKSFINVRPSLLRQLSIPEVKQQLVQHSSQSGHIFWETKFPELSLSFPWDFQGIFKFSLSNWRGKNSLEYIFIGDYVIIYFTFSLSFPSLWQKFNMRFWQFLEFLEFFKFLAKIQHEILTVFLIPWVFQLLQLCGHSASRTRRKC